MAFVPEDEQLLWLSVFNCKAFNNFIGFFAGNVGGVQYEAGLIQKVPVPNMTSSDRAPLSTLSKRAWSIRRSIDTHVETSHAFVLPAVLQITGVTLLESTSTWAKYLFEANCELFNIQEKIDDFSFNLYGLAEADRYGITEGLVRGGVSASDEIEVKEDEDNEDGDNLDNTISLVGELLSWAFGCALGRFNLQQALGKEYVLPEYEPFAPLPICSPGVLQNTNGLPIEAQEVPSDYPLRISWPGILVDDEGHKENIAGRVREVIEVIWKDKAGDIEHEACEILGVRSLRDYFGKPSGFFAEHLKRYSKSRRQAPIYWPLSTPSGSYILWLYYHRLTDQTIYTCVMEYIEPKLRDVATELANLRQKGSGRNRDDEKKLEKLQDFETELQEFRDEPLRLTRLPWKPNLNDGVQITAAPLWKLFQLPKWKKTLKENWEKLEKGDYDWAHLAYSIWPDRVKKKCVTDKSIAIAHDLEDLYVEPPASAKKKRGKKTAVVEDEEE